MAFSVGVAGASGYAGGELLRLLLTHPSLSLSVATAASNAGEPVNAVHPHLPQLSGWTFAPTDPQLLARNDVVFVALPHGQSAALATQLPDDVLVIDLGADFRLRDADAWLRFYGGEHAGTWAYGLPELPGARAALAGARRIANPGCYATAAALAFAPLLHARLIDPTDLVMVAASGTTGAGRMPRTNLLASEVMGSMTPYKVGGMHQHTPEIEQSLSGVAARSVTMSFTPLLAPMPRGILATCTARPTRSVTTSMLRDAVEALYAAEPFVHLMPDAVWPATAATLGSNSAQIQVVFDEHANRIVAVIALDNLTKGAAGQALQNANIALGLDETAGLPIAGVAP